MIGARCGHADGLYDQPGGTSGPGIMRMPGMPGMSRTKAITSAPASVSLANAAAGRCLEHERREQQPHPDQRVRPRRPHRPRRSVTAANAITRAPLITSLQVSAVLR